MLESTKSSGPVAGPSAIVGTVRSAISTARSILRWITLLIFSAIWIVFWANLALLHFSLGDVVAVVISLVPVVLPPAFVLLLVLRER